ncbi:MAG: tRNA 2-thiouridine(34) synthase MnmA [Hyphomicrobiaceae bacterium]|nr:tRNA 2-thiouridine(34) synthase MnmA [Hyphomicrobiaceae bacterium]
MTISSPIPTSDTQFRAVASATTAPAHIELPTAVRRALQPLKSGARVVVAMSGGVDSSVVAAILKHAGYDVIGMTMQLYDHGTAVGKAGSCCAGQDIHDARTVAANLGIPHYVLDYEKRFRERVITPFIDSYVQGETPIPCVSCNSDLKFGELLSTAETLGADALATGHYVQRVDGATGAELRRAHDTDRDQSYFLFSTTRTQLAKLVFPLGGLAKPEVRALAHAFGIAVADKADSQDICFVPAGRYTDVIERLKPGAADPGDIVHVDGRVLGQHNGIVHFTVGQRKGLGIATGEPLFVVRLEPAQRRVIVGPRTHLGVNRIRLRGVNWLGQVLPTETQPQAVFVRTRSSQPLRRGSVAVGVNGSAMVMLDLPEHGISPGQAAVFYADDKAQAQVLGGGFIAETKLELPVHEAVEADSKSADRPKLAVTVPLSSGEIDT